MRIGKQRHFPFKWTLALLMTGIALAAGRALWGLRKRHHRQYHLTATSEVLEIGTAIAAHLAEQPEVKTAEEVTSWRRFENLLKSLSTVEHGLQYVAVTENGVVLFQRQAGTDQLHQESAPTATVDRATMNEVQL